MGNPTPLQLTGSMTLSAWVKASANPVDDGQIIAKSDNASGWQLKTSPDTGPHRFAVAVSAGLNSRTQRYSTTVRQLDVWYYVAGVYNATAQTLDIYVNGVLDNGPLRGTIPSAQLDSPVNVNMGRRSGGLYFGGIVDEVRVYNRALSQAEIQADMATAIGTPAATVSLPTATIDTAATNFTQPVVTSTINAAADLIGFQGDFTFNENVVTFQTNPVSTAGLTASNWVVLGNVLPGAGPIRTLRVSAYAKDGNTGLSGSGTLFNLNMTRVSNTPGASTPLTWSAPPESLHFYRRRFAYDFASAKQWPNHYYRCAAAYGVDRCVQF